jgi:hypothetical protein
MTLDLPAIFTARVSCAALATILVALAGAPPTRAQQATPDGDPFLVNGPTVTDGGQEDPDISRTGSGYVIVWESDAEVNEVIWGQRYDDDGNRVGNNFAVSLFDESQIDPVVSRADDFVVVWQNTNGNNIWGQRFDAQGDKAGIQFQVNNVVTENEQELPAIASDDQGNFVVVYESFDFADDGDEIVGHRFSNIGERQGTEFLVNFIIDDDQQDPSVGRQPGGSFLVAWESDDGEGLGENSGIWAQVFNANGDKLNPPEFRVNQFAEGNQESPDVGAWPGGYVVTWVHEDEAGRGVWARRFDSNGDPLGGNFLVNTIQDLDQRDPAVSVFDGGEFVIVWQDDDFGSQGQEFDAAGEKLGQQFDISLSDKIEEKPRVQVREGGYMPTWFGASADELDNDVFGRNYIVPEPGSALLGLAALSTLAVLARTRRSRP